MLLFLFAAEETRMQRHYIMQSECQPRSWHVAVPPTEYEWVRLDSWSAAGPSQHTTAEHGLVGGGHLIKTISMYRGQDTSTSQIQDLFSCDTELHAVYLNNG